MTRSKLIVLLLLVTTFMGHAQTYEWSSVVMDGSRTGCTPFAINNLEGTLGVFLEDGTYIAPNGRIYAAGSLTARTAAIVRDAQEPMKRVKTVIIQSDAEMRAYRYETPLSNWYVNMVMQKVGALAGKKIDVGIGNFGGIRVNMPKGDVTLDDMLSMFPFKNYVVYLEHKGSELRKIFEKMAATRFEAVGGVEIVAENKKLTKALIGGEPIDDDKLYTVATISFLLYGGDNLTLAENAVNMEIYDVTIIDMVMEYIDNLKKEGKNITPPTDRYVVIK